MSSLNKTFLANEKLENHNWYIIDCKNQKLGRLATVVADILNGKTKLHYHPSLKTGDSVILINADSIIVNKSSKHYLVFNPGRPGSSLKIRSAHSSLPKFAIEHAIRGMLARTKKRRLMKRINIYNGSSHPHQAQNPVTISI